MGKDAKDEYIERLEQENAELRKRLHELEQRIQELERLIKQNSKDSSEPPSSDFGRNAKTNKPTETPAS